MMRAKCKLAMKEAVNATGFLLPTKHLNHQVLGKGMKRTSEKVFIKPISSSTIKELRDPGQVPSSLLSSFSMVKRGIRVT